MSITVENPIESEGSRSKKKRSAGGPKQPRQGILNLHVDTGPKHQSQLGVSHEIPQVDISGGSGRGVPRSGLRRRRDQFGTRIQKNSKRHKVSFVD